MITTLPCAGAVTLVIVVGAPPVTSFASTMTEAEWPEVTVTASFLASGGTPGSMNVTIGPRGSSVLIPVGTAPKPPPSGMACSCARTWACAFAAVTLPGGTKTNPQVGKSAGTAAGATAGAAAPAPAGAAASTGAGTTH